MSPNRYGIKTAPEGCGDDPTAGACESCTMRAVRRGKWAIRQLLPLKYATHYFTGGNPNGVMGDESDVQYVNVTYWRMWLGRVFKYETHRWPIAS